MASRAFLKGTIPCCCGMYQILEFTLCSLNSIKDTWESQSGTDTTATKACQMVKSRFEDFLVEELQGVLRG